MIAELPDRVVWLPTNARGCALRASLGVTAGNVVTVSAGGAS
jgi:NADH-quinone oxidoreductase subunit G